MPPPFFVAGRRIDSRPAPTIVLPMNVELPESPTAAARLTPAQARLELAVTLFQQERLSLGLASEMAGLAVAEMMSELCRRKIPLHYDVRELEEDIATLQRLKLL